MEIRVLELYIISMSVTLKPSSNFEIVNTKTLYFIFVMQRKTFKLN